MTDTEYGATLAATAPPLTDEQVAEAARLLAAAPCPPLAATP